MPIFTTPEDEMESHPGEFVSAFLAQIAECHSFIEFYSTLIFKNIDIGEIELTAGMPLQASIAQACNRLSALVMLMNGYRRAYAVANTDLRANAQSNHWLEVLDEVIDLSEQGPSAALARFRHEMADCWTVLDQCSKIVFENASVDIESVESSTGLDIRQAIRQCCHRLQHLVGLMDVYRQTLTM
jgi:hypothetical protein